MKREGRFRVDGLVLIAVGAGLLIAGCSQATAAATPTQPPPVAAAQAFPPPTATTQVQIQGYAFHPQAITVPVGSTVTWHNLDLDQHTVTADHGAFNSDIINSGDTYSFRFMKVGTYDYHCQIHPFMHGRVVVTAR